MLATEVLSIILKDQHIWRARKLDMLVEARKHGAECPGMNEAERRANRRGKQRGTSKRTREIIASWLARCVLHCLQPKILSELR